MEAEWDLGLEPLLSYRFIQSCPARSNLAKLQQSLGSYGPSRKGFQECDLRGLFGLSQSKSPLQSKGGWEHWCMVKRVQPEDTACPVSL